LEAHLQNNADQPVGTNGKINGETNFNGTEVWFHLYPLGAGYTVERQLSI
jgi:hypothetical protein